MLPINWNSLNVAVLACEKWETYLLIHLCIWEFSNPTDTSAKNVTLCGGFTELAELNYLCVYTLYYFAVTQEKPGAVWSNIANPCFQL